MAAEIQIPNAEPIPKVQPLLLMEEKTKADYIPKVVSIGPYHYKEGAVHLRPVEAFKPVAVNLFVSGCQHDHDFYCNKVLEMIGEIRNCYEHQSTAGLSDKDLATMMVRDACLIIIHMEVFAPEAGQRGHSTEEKLHAMIRHLGILTMASVQCDLFLLENQIPLKVVKRLMDSGYGSGEFEKLLDRFLKKFIFGEYRQESKSPQENTNRQEKKKEPLHLLEACHRLVVSELKKTCRCLICRWLRCCKVEEQTGAAPTSYHDCVSRLLGCSRVKKETGADPTPNQRIGCLLKFLACKNVGAAKEHHAGRDLKRYVYSFRSVTDLKAKGIFFRPSSTQSLKDVDFKSYCFCAKLELPEWGVSIYTRALFLNMIAYELSPSSRSQAEVTSYINFMKSLIERPEDVKELREKKILYNMLGSDEEVLNVYKDINTYGANNPQIFQRVKDKIEAHCSSKMKPWMAELFHTHFRTPWTLIAFLAAVTLLALTAVQVYYAVHPK